MYSSRNLRKWLVLALATPLFFNVFPAQADVWSDCMFPNMFAPSSPYYFGPNENEFKGTGYNDPINSPTRTIYWAGFALNGGFIDSNPSDVYKDGDVWGDIGVAGNGNVSIQDGFTLHKGFMGRGGDLYYRVGGKYTKSGKSLIEGNVHSDSNSDDILNKGYNYVLGATEYAWSLAATPVFVNGSATPSMPTTVNLKNQNMSVSIVGTGNNCNVLRLQDFVMQGGTFTLQGTMTQSIVINVNRDFVMNGGAKIVLQGLQWDNVLFNIHGKGNVVSLDQASYLRGIILAPKRHVRLKGGSTVFGQVIGEEIELASLSKIKHPSVTSE